MGIDNDYNYDKTSLGLMRTIQRRIIKSSLKRILTGLLILAIATGMVGCSALRGGAPEPSFDVNKDLEQLAKYFPADSISKFYDDKNATDKDRNKFITGRITMINIRYIQFVRQLTTDKQLLDTASAMLVLGTSIAGASFAAASTKTVLAAVSAGITGSKEAIDKNYFFEKTIPALVGQMNAERKKALIPLLVGSKASLEDYPFAYAVTDLHNYYFAGTFVGAIQSIQADAAIKEGKADIEIDNLRKSKFSEDESSRIIRAFLRPPDGKPTDPLNQANYDLLVAWLKKSVVPDLPPAVFLSTKELRSLREQAIREIPFKAPAPAAPAPGDQPAAPSGDVKAGDQPAGGAPVEKKDEGSKPK